MPDFRFQEIFELGKDETPYRALESEGLVSVETLGEIDEMPCQGLRCPPDLGRDEPFSSHRALDEIAERQLVVRDPGDRRRRSDHMDGDARVARHLTRELPYGKLAIVGVSDHAGWAVACWALPNRYRR